MYVSMSVFALIIILEIYFIISYKSQDTNIPTIADNQPFDFRSLKGGTYCAVCMVMRFNCMWEMQSPI